MANREHETSGLSVDLVRESTLWDAMNIPDRVLIRAAEAAFAAARPADSLPYELAILLSSDDAVRDLNRAWRGKDTPTNVLSFPAGEHTIVPRPLGDIALAAETVAREAEEQHILVADHAAHLVVHGVLHLLGHDHLQDEEAEDMEALETRVLATLGIADPYAAASLAADIAERPS